MEDFELTNGNGKKDVNDEYEYLIPKNIRTRFEFFPGIGIVELLYIVIGLAIAFILYKLTGLFTKSFYRLIYFVIGFLIPFALVYQEPRNGVSLLRVLKDLKKFKSKPRRYIYVHGKGRLYD